VYLFTLEVYFDREENSNIAAAVVNAWICDEKLDKAKTLVLNSICSEGWKIAKVISIKKVTDSDYNENDEGREFFLQANIDKEVYYFHNIERLAVYKNWEYDSLYEPGNDYYREIKNLKKANKVWLPFHNGETCCFSIEEQTIIPVFSDEEMAHSWVAVLFEGCEAKQMDKGIIKFYEDTNQMLAVTDTTNDCLVTTSKYQIG